MGVTSIVEGLSDIVSDIIEKNLEQINESDEFIVETSFGKKTYQLDEIDPAEDLCFQGLIHNILYEKGIYESFLNPSQMDQVKNLIEESPYSIYYPDPDSNEGSHDEVMEDLRALEKIEEIHHRMIVFVGKHLLDLGFEVPVLEEYLEESGEEMDE